MKPYYQDEAVTIYHGDALEILPDLEADVLVTDPPYPNNAGHFDDAVPLARDIVRGWDADALVFWSELEIPETAAPLVAVHIWHRSNVNGRPYEPIFHFARDGAKKRSEVFRHPAIFNGAGPGCVEYLGHPTQKPVALMGALMDKTEGTVLDPFAGSGSTLEAAKARGRKAIGIEREERYCETAAKRCEQEVLDLAA